MATRGFPAFAAIDFETADNPPESACAVAVVRVESGVITRARVRRIRPPSPHFRFTRIHGITWSDVAGEPPFAEVWPSFASLLEGVAFLAAHNAAFDRRVLGACCDAAGLERPNTGFVCTVQVARRVWDVRPTKLPDVCRHLRLPLDHHDPLSDARACAGIVIAALKAGWKGPEVRGR